MKQMHHIIKMTRPMDDLLKMSKNPDDLLCNIFISLIFGFKIHDYSKYNDKECDNYTMSYKLNVENKILTVGLGKDLVKKIKKYDIDLMLIYAENILDESKELVKKTYIDGIVELDKEQTMFDVFDNTYILFKEEEDYAKFVNKVISVEKEKE